MESGRTHRDTLAFVLVILGATLWAVYPAITLLKDEGYGPEVVLPITFAVGALLGAWAGTTVWRHVPLLIPVAAATLLAAGIEVLQSRAWNGTLVIGVHQVICVAGAAAGAAAGAFLARHARKPQRALVAAWMTIGGPVLLGLGLAALQAVGYDLVNRGTAWILMLAVVPAAAIAVRLCGGVRPAPFTSWMFGMLASALLISTAEKAPDRSAGKFVAAIVCAAIFAWLASIPVRRAHRLRPAPDDLPSARVVERQP